MRAVYKVTDIIRLGLSSLTVHKVRSVMTVLGIVFGVWSVIAMLAISKGASYESQQALRQLGSTNIIVNSVEPSDESASERQRQALQYGLNDADVARLGSLPGVRQYVTTHRTDQLAYTGGTKDVRVKLVATSPELAEVSPIRVLRGRFLTDVDMVRPNSFCVITEGLARRLLGPVDPIGRSIRISGHPFVIVGVVRRLPERIAGDANQADSCVVISHLGEKGRFGTLNVQRSTGGWSAELVEVSQVILQMEDEQTVLEAAGVVRNLLQRTHSKNDFDVFVPKELIEQMQEQARLWNYVLLAIAMVSLLVGGIGIMNIMLASVTERTREIGIRRALGAKRRDIVTQFLVESVTLTTVGGLVGIAVGLAVPWLLERTLGRPAIATAWTLILPFIVAVVVGLISGLYPALRAARLDPIVALRHE
ncbi:MAG: ABC transporter permease [Phycisphaerae bacterium]